MFSLGKALMTIFFFLIWLKINWSKMFFGGIDLCPKNDQAPTFFGTKYFGLRNFHDSKIFRHPKLFWNTKLSGTRNFLKPKIIQSPKFSASQNFCWLKIFWDPKFFLTQDPLGLQNFSGPKFFFYKMFLNFTKDFKTGF